MSKQRLEPLPLSAIGPAFDEHLLAKIYQEYAKTINQSDPDFLKKVACAFLAWRGIRHLLRVWQVPDDVEEKRFCEGREVAMRFWFSYHFDIWASELEKN